MRRSALIGVLVLAATSVATPARGGTYDVVSCGSGGGVNHAWSSFNEDAASLATGTRCSPLSGGAESGLFAVDRIPGPPNAAKGRGTAWRIAAPAGTRITRLTAQYYLGQRSDGEWFPYLRTASGQVLDTCQPPGGDPVCERGTNLPGPLGPMWTYAVDTSGLEAGVRCMATSGSCGNGASLHAAWVALYFTRVQITDSAAPSPPGLAPPVGSPGYLRGSPTFTVSASDATGIRATRLEVDGITRSSSARVCDYTYVVPCSNEPGGGHALDTRALADGPHTLRAVAEDAAGNQANRSVAMTVDNTAPSRPLKLRVWRAKGSSRTSPTPQLRWTNPSGQLAPIAAARWSLCRRGTSKCVVGRRRVREGAAKARTGSLGSPLRDGKWTARLWLEDAAGNADLAHAARVRVVVRRLRPRLRIASVRRRGDRVTVRGTTAARRGQIRARVEGRLSGQTLSAHGRAPIRMGRWSKRLRLRGRLAEAGRVRLVVRFPAQRGYRARTLRRTVR